MEQPTTSHNITSLFKMYYRICTVSWCQEKKPMLNFALIASLNYILNSLHRSKHISQWNLFKFSIFVQRISKSIGLFFPVSLFISVWLFLFCFFTMYALNISLWSLINHLNYILNSLHRSKHISQWNLYILVIIQM
jgi:hypothetical protein